MSAAVLIAVVLYRMTPQDSATVQGLAAAMRSSEELRSACEVVLWDNSPEPPNVPAPLDAPFRYHHAATNDGVAGAFNGALAICIQCSYEWMLLLDQDTEVTSGYLLGMLRHRENAGRDERIAAIAPLLFDRGLQLSPQQVHRYGQTPVAPEPARMLEGEVFAANSGVLMRVAALKAVGGYSRDFWLDHSDMYVFHQMYRLGQRVYLAADLRLQHSMTMRDYDGRMTPARYSNFLHAEQAFFDMYKSADQNAVQVLRLSARTVRQRRYRSKVYAQMTWKFLLRRLSTSKAARLVAWQARAAARQRHADAMQAGA